jgi:hypothetical protein
MSVSAKKLSKTGASVKAIDAVAREQTQIIDDKLMRHERTWGRNVVRHDLPMSINMPGLTKKDAQLMLYSHLIRAYERQGFEVAIVIQKDSASIYLAWATELSAEETAAMNALVMSRRMQPDEITHYYRESRIAAPEIRSPDSAAPAPPRMREGAGREMRARGGVAVPEPAAPAPPVGEPVITAAEASLLGAI